MTDHAKLVATVPIFRGLTSTLYDQLVSIATEQTFKKGVQLFRQGDDADGLYIVVDGALAVLRETASGEKPLARVKKHESLGELTLLAPCSVRTATVTAVKDTKVVIIPHKGFHKLVKKDAELLSHCVSALLSNVPIFRGVGNIHLSQLARVATPEQFKRGTAIFYEGDRGDALYIILGGSVKVYRKVEGDEKIFATLRDGEMLGELALLDQQSTRTASVSALEDTAMLMIKRNAFRELTNRTPELLWEIIGALCERIREMNQQTLDLSFEEVPYRLVRILSDLAEKHGGTGPIETNMSPSELGKMVGADRQTTRRVFKLLADNNLVELDLDQVIIPKPRALKRALEYAREWF